MESIADGENGDDDAAKTDEDEDEVTEIEQFLGDSSRRGSCWRDCLGGVLEDEKDDGHTVEAKETMKGK